MQRITKLGMTVFLCSVVAPAQWAAITEYPTTTANSAPENIVAGPDGALWFTEFAANSVGRISPTGVFTEYPTNTSNSTPFGIALGPDGALWFTESSANAIGRIATDGVMIEYPLPSPNSYPAGIVAGSDGALWFTDGTCRIDRITTSGVITGYAIPTFGGCSVDIVAGPDGALWFTEFEPEANKIGRITTAGAFTEYPIPTGFSRALGITAGPDGALWFTENSKIGRITTDGNITEYPLPTLGSAPQRIAVGADGALWFTEQIGDNIGRITTSGTINEYPVPTLGAFPTGITLGPDGALWFAEPAEYLENFGPGKIGRAAPTSTLPTAVATASVPNGEVGVPYVVSPRATGGSPPYQSWTVSDGALPPGLTLNGSSGIISGIPVNIGISSFSITVVDSEGTVSAPKNFTIAVGFSVEITGPSALQGGNVGIAYPPLGGGGITFSSTGGWPPLVWSATGLPGGMNMSPAGVLSGTPAGGSVGIYPSTFTVTDSTNASATVTLPLTITVFGSLQISGGATLSEGIVGMPYSQILSATGGTPPYAWSAPGGAPGLTLSNTGVISGTPSAAGEYDLAVKVTDSASNTQTRLFDITIGLNLVGSMAHVAAEGGWNTTFTMVNKGTTSAQTQLSLYDNSGNALAAPLTIGPNNLPIPMIGSVLDTLAPNASFLVKASGSANVPYVEGSAQLGAFGSVDGFAIFHYDPTQQEAVVPMETRNAGSYLLPFDNTNSVLTGVALENSSGTAAIIPVIIRSEAGAQILTTTIALPASGHSSFVLSTQYPATGNNRGTIEFDTPGFGTSTAQKISALGIRYTGGTLTTIPVLANVSNTGGLLAHLTSGAGWQTTFALVNTSATTASATLQFFGDDGSALALPLTVLETGAPSNGSTVTKSIAPGASVWIQSSALLTSALVTGSARLTTSGDVSGYAIFRYNPNGQEAVVPLESRAVGSYLIAFDNANGTTTGVAIAAMSSQTETIPVIVRDYQGNILTTSAITLNANGHTSFVLATQYPQAAGMRGTAEFETPPGTQISVLGIRSPPALTFTTLPALAN